VQGENRLDSGKVAEKAVHSLKWSVLTEVVSRTASPIILVVLARLLAPDVFGVVATATIAISFSQMLWDAGLSKALIQIETARDEAANVVFWTNACLGVLTYVCLFLLAPAIAGFFKSPDSGPVLRILGLQIIIASLSSVQQALFVRGLAFRGLFWIKLLTSFVPGLFSIPMALFGLGVWALVSGTIAGQFLNLLLLWHYSSWRPKFSYNFPVAKQILRFGFWVLAEALGGWLLMWSDALIVGRYFGVHDLGVYRTGIMVTTIIYSLMLNSFLPILYPSFSRLQNDLSALTRNFHRVARMVMALAFPMGIGLLLLGQDIAGALFGNKWAGLGFVVSIIGLKEGLTWAVGINAETYRAIGRPDVNTKLMLLQVLYFLPAYFLAAHSGMVTFVYVRMAVALAAIPIQVFVCHRVLGLSLFYLWQDGKHSLIAAVVMGVGVYMGQWSLHYLASGIPAVLSLALLLMAGVSIYGISLWVMDKAFIQQITLLARRAVST
jgi:PST family polysaccharide transporter